MKLFNISAFLLSILLFTYTNSMSQDTSCAEYEQECNKTPPLPWLSSYKDVVLPQFPLCTVRVYYQHRECGNPPCHSTQWTITSIQYLDTNCNTIDLWLTNNGMGITSEKVRDLKIMLIQAGNHINKL
ncbi:MAG TPA: hypothetical protein PLE30_00990 [Candidatus Kapabacteria bacterium]|nr:hypothetical protein [Candidatus Kapabacteria bacterium]